MIISTIASESSRDDPVSLMFTRETNKLSQQVERLWDLDSVGIREGDHVHERFKDNVTFDGTRYVVELPWKEAKYVLPSNKDICEGRLKSLVK